MSRIVWESGLLGRYYNQFGLIGGYVGLAKTQGGYNIRFAPINEQPVDFKTPAKFKHNARKAAKSMLSEILKMTQSQTREVA